MSILTWVQRFDAQFAQSHHASEGVLKARLRDAPEKRIADVRDHSVVRIVGVARRATERVLRAPISGRLCAAWRVTVETGPALKMVVDEHDAQDFCVEDGPDRAHVTPHALHLLLDFDHQRYQLEPLGFSLPPDLSTVQGLLDSPNPASESIQDYLGTHSLRSGELGSYRIQEGVLEYGERVAVWGEGVWREGTVKHFEGYRSVTRKRELEIGPVQGKPVIVSDDPAFTRGAPGQFR